MEEGEKRKSNRKEGRVHTYIHTYIRIFIEGPYYCTFTLAFCSFKSQAVNHNGG